MLKKKLVWIFEGKAILLNSWKWSLGMVAKQVKLLLHQEQKIVLGVKDVNLPVLQIF
jgi:hypothetical protein